MTKRKSNNRIDITDTVSALNAPESNFQTRAARAGDYVDLIAHHNERGSKVVEDEEGMIPHN